MKISRIATLLFTACLAASSLCAVAQDKPKTKERDKNTSIEAVSDADSFLF